MKARLLILLCIIIAFILYRADLSFSCTKKLTYFNCTTHYTHTYLTWDDFLLCKNYYDKLNAELEIGRCLCENTNVLKDLKLRKHILTLYMSYPELEDKYIKEVLYKSDTSILMKYAERIYKEDPRILNSIKKYKHNKEVLSQILRNYLDESYNARENYDAIILNLPFEPPKIDTIVKYKDIIFESVHLSCGGS